MKTNLLVIWILGQSEPTVYEDQNIAVLKSIARHYYKVNDYRNIQVCDIQENFEY